MTQLVERRGLHVIPVRLPVVLIAGFLAASLALSACDDEPSGPPPIVLIMVDTLRADYLGVYGFQGDVSPNLDRFATESVVFGNCFSQAPWTKPSIASLFTSLHVPVHGLRFHGEQFGREGRVRKSVATNTLDDNAVTLAEALREGGYATGAFVANPWIRAAHGFSQGFDVFDAKGAGNAVTAERPFAAAREWMEGLPQDQPFFLYVHVMDVHGPYDAPEKDYEAVRESPSLGDDERLSKSDLSRMPLYLRRSKWLPSEEGNTREVRARYAASVRAFDGRLQGFFEVLRGRNVMDEAVIIVTSDHGEQLYEHRRWDHGNSLYDEELHVPLIIRLPGASHAGKVIPRIVSLVDVMPTILALAGLSAVEGTQGEDLSAFLDGRDDATKDLATFATAVKWKPALYSARTDRYKLIKDVNRTTGKELYDLRKDAAEATNVEERESSALKSMEGALATFFAGNERRETLEPGAAEIPPDVQERLRALGYDQKRQAE